MSTILQIIFVASLRFLNQTRVLLNEIFLHNREISAAVDKMEKEKKKKLKAAPEATQTKRKKEQPNKVYGMEGEVWRIKQKMSSDYEMLRNNTSFDDWELACVLVIFSKLATYGGLDLEQFRYFLHNVFGVSRPDMVDQIYLAMDDPSRGPGLRAPNFVRLMAVYCRGNLEERMDLAFQVYDSTWLGYVDRNMIFRIMVLSLNGLENEIAQMATDMADLLMLKVDKDRDGRITLDEYRAAVRKNPDLLEIMGPVFPDRKKVRAFLSTFTANTSIDEENYLVRRNLNYTYRSKSSAPPVFTG